MNAPNMPLHYLPKVLLSEAMLWRRLLVGVFVFVNVAFVVAGLTWPRNFTSSATIYVEERSIIQPLMQGTAVATNITDRAKIAREIIFSRKIMDQVMESIGWFGTVSPSQLEQEQIIDSVKKATRITNVGTNLVRVEYQDDNPQRAHKITQQFADLFIQESTMTQTRESAVAFEFIDGQVKEYHEKLTQAEQALKEFRSAHVDARPGTEVQITTKITTLQAGIEKATLDLKEARIKQGSIEKQLSGEAVVATSLTREGQFVSRIADLQTQLDALRLSYHDTYPDIVRLKHQIEELRDLAEGERKKREEAKNAIKSGDSYAVDETVRVTPIYQKLRTELLDTKTNIETLTARLTETQQLLKTELERANKMYGGEATLAELTRDYEVNRDIYHDLLKRRENARVSKNLDANKQGLTMRIQEPASLPVAPSGFRFMHFVMAGVVGSLLLPLGILFGLQQIDSRARVPVLISERLRIPVLATVPRLVTPDEMVRTRRSLNRLAIAVFATVAFVVVAGVLKLSEVL
jgi:polysaccharide chain length determinant protein (PEP-CTERM system associated)